MKYFIAPYELKPLYVPNAKSTLKTRSGILLKIQTPNGVGYSCLQVWEELGDLPLEQHIHSLKRILTPQMQSAVLLAEKDLAARTEGRSLVGESRKIRNHCTLTQVTQLTQANSLREQGFREVKMKVSPSTEKNVLKTWSEEGFRLRLDANLSLGWDSAVELCSDVKDAVDFFEDPFVGSEQDYLSFQRETGIGLAWDQGLKNLHQNLIFVVKPSRDQATWSALKEKPSKFLVTSNMDHPLGQAQALAFAIETKPTHACGLITHPFFAGNAYSEYLHIENSSLVIDEDGSDAGYGFTRLLEKEKWQQI